MTTAIAFALKNWKLLLGGIGVLLLGIYIVHLKGEVQHWHKESDRYAGLFHDEQAAFKQTVANYRAAADLARAQDAANKARVERDQANISQEASHDYQERLAALRARYDAIRLRGQGSAAPGNSGVGGTTGLPGTGQGARGSAQTADEEGLSLDDRFVCSAQAEQLDALITWVERQQAVSIDQPEKVLPPG